MKNVRLIITHLAMAGLLLLQGLNKPLSASPTPMVTLAPFPAVCIDALPFQLTGGSPLGGVYQGNGVIDGIFYPAIAGAGTIAIQYSVMDAGGTISSASATITVYNVPNPFIVASDTLSFPQQDSGNSSPGCAIMMEACEKFCAFSTITYHTASVPGNTFAWNVSGGTVVSGANSNTVTVVWGDIGIGSIEIIEITPNGCADSASVCIELVPNTVADFTAEDVCLGSETKFTNQSTDANNYHWDFGDGTASAEENPVHLYAASGTYLVTLIVENQCGCSDTVEKPVVVDPLAGPAIGCVSTVCAGDNDFYSTSASCGTYNWTVTGGTILSGANTSEIRVNWGAGPIGEVTLEVANCSPAYCTKPTTVSVPIIPSSLGISGPETVCQWSSADYEAPLFPGAVYTWTVTPSSAGTIIEEDYNSVKINWNGEPAGTVAVSIVHPFTKCVSSGSLPVTVVPSVYLSGGSLACADEQNTFTLSPSSYAATWNVSGGNIVSGQGTNSITVEWNTGSANFTVTANNVTPAACNTPAISGAILNVPPPDSISGPEFICPGSSATYQAYTSFAGEVAYQWEVSGGSISVQNENIVTVNWDNAGPYQISVALKVPKDFPVCTSDLITKTISLLDAGTVSIAGPDVLCPNEEYSFIATPSFSDLDYQWEFASDYGAVIEGNGTSEIKIQTLETTGSANINLSIENCGNPIAVSFLVTVLNKPQPVVPDGAICPGESITVSAAPAFASYSWRDEAQTEVETAATVTLNTVGFYSLEAIDADGCKGMEIFEITAKPVPDMVITTPDDQVYCIGQPINATLYAEANPGYTYEWTKNNNPISTASTYVATSDGNYKVSVTNSYNCTVSNSIQIVVIDCSCGGIPICPCTGETGICDSLPPCPCTGGNPIDFDFSFDCDKVNFADITPVSNQKWFFDDGSISTQTDPSHTYANAGYYNVFLVDLSTLNYIMKIVTIELAAHFSWHDQCGTFTFEDLSTHIPNTTISSWSWDFGDGASSTLQNPTHTYTTPGSYTVTLTISNGSFTSCITQTVIVENVISPDFTPSSLCAGIPVYLENLTAGNVLEWQWDFGDGTSSGLFDPYHTYENAGNENVSLTATDYRGCEYSASQSLNIVAPPSPGTIASDGPLTFCENGSVTLTAPAGTAYLWSTGGTTASINVSNAGSYDVISVINGCPVISETALIELIPAPPLIISDTTGVLCEGYSIYANYSSNYSYQWYLNGTVIAGQTSWFSGSLTASGNYSVQVTDNTTGCTAMVDQSIAIVAPPEPAAITGENSSCNTPVILTAAAGNNTVSVVWSTGETYSSLTVTESGQYYAISYNEGCSSYSNFFNVEIHPLPDLSEFPAGCYEECNPVDFAIDPGFQTYQWSMNGNTISGISGNSFTVAGNGTYTVSVTDNNGCSNTSGILEFSLQSAPETDSAVTGSFCFQNNGTAAVFPVIQGEQLTYQWNTGSTDSIITGLAPGIYSVTVTNQYGCKDSLEVTITESNPPVETDSMVTNTFCYQTNGIATVTPAIPGDILTYIWEDGSTASSLSYLDTGVYFVTVTNQLGCSEAVAVIVGNTAAPALELGFSDSLSMQCGWYNGQAEVIVSGGLTPYAYQWGSNAGNQTDATVTGLSPGIYVVTITDQCTQSLTDTVEVGAIDSLSMMVSGDSVQLNCEQTNGVAAVLASGGISPYTYTWGGDLNNFTTPVVAGLAAGTYYVTITDQCNHAKEEKVVIEDPDCEVLAPNSFTPNADGVNDVFMLKGIGIEESDYYLLYIYDRWGDIIYKSEKYSEGWDGTAREQGGTKVVQEDVYVWQVWYQKPFPFYGLNYKVGHVAIVK